MVSLIPMRNTMSYHEFYDMVKSCVTHLQEKCDEATNSCKTHISLYNKELLKGERILKSLEADFNKTTIKGFSPMVRYQ